LNTAEAKRLISQIAEAGARLIILDGGEPLMRPDIFDLVRHSRSVGLTTVMGTNGTLITTEVAARLVEAGIQALAISLDGADKETHDAFRGAEGVWEQTLQGKDAISPMPPFVRQRALRTIIEASETFARERGSEVVQEKDVIRAAETKTPALTRRRMLDALAEMGIRVEMAEETKR
jgi:wyosine [tRNA(Phe)-imidazoG37] synthetase (radical SAM superfamily)